jgi:hypothetical protein
VTAGHFGGLRGASGVSWSADKRVLTMVFIMVTEIQLATLTGKKVLLCRGFEVEGQ